MNTLQEFAINNIYCSPAEDRQFRFTLVRATKPGFPVMRAVAIYDKIIEELPTKNDQYHVYIIGAVPPYMLNLYKNPGKDTCNRTGWVNVADDMNERDYIFQVYDDDGVTFPRHLIYYKLNKNNNLIIAVKIDANVRRKFDFEKIKYMRVYSNPYFGKMTTGDYIMIKSMYVPSIREVVALQREVEKFEGKRGTAFYFVNGYMTRILTPDIAIGNFVECFYDTSLKSIEEFPVLGLRTYSSEKDKRNKYFLHRKRDVNYIEFFDDTEIYLSTRNKQGVEEAVYYYQNKDIALRNVTDKDFGIDAKFVTNQSQVLANRNKDSATPITILLMTRHQSFERSLIYSALKLHELYKLPFKKEYDVISNMANTIPDFTAEYLENSDYFRLAGLPDLGQLTPELAMDTIGYSAVVRYFATTPNKYLTTLFDVPPLYRHGSLVYEYDQDGRMIEWHSFKEATYASDNPLCDQLEFVQGMPLNDFTLYVSGDKFKLEYGREFRIIAAMHEGRDRRADWEDRTNHPDVVIDGLDVEFKGNPFISYRVVYLDDPYVYQLEWDITRYFNPIKLVVDELWRGEYVSRYLDRYYDTVEVFLNGYRLTEGVDYFMDFPTISICNKTYIDYSKPKAQQVHVRCCGFTLNKRDINKTEQTGFVHHGVVGRNGLYDIRDDRVFSCFIDGKLQERGSLKFAEQDKTVRTDHKLNGVPYTIAEKKLSITRISELPTEPYYQASREKDARISGLFTKIFPEPKVKPFIVGQHEHFLFSPVVSMIIRDMLFGVISSDLYTNLYQDLTIRELIDKEYKELLLLDPIDKEFPDNVVRIHPDYGNAPITVNLYQYRFITNVVRLLTNGDPDKVNLSAYLYINEDVEVINPNKALEVKGPVVLK